jgi:cyclophilin family peptidyl-prolyl cis-trans isomerase
MDTEDIMVDEKVIQIEDISVADQPERRRSERLKKEVHVTTNEKNEAMAKKRNLEGNSKAYCNLSDIDNLTLNDLAKNMGVIVQKEIFVTFDMIKDLEAARNCLYSKQHKQMSPDMPLEIVELNLEAVETLERAVSENDSDVNEILVQQIFKKIFCQEES